MGRSGGETPQILNAKGISAGANSKALNLQRGEWWDSQS